MKIIPIPGSGISSNVYLIVDTKAVLIDSGCDERIEQKIMKMGLPSEAISMIINTHCHYDHIKCNELFTEAEVCMHSIDAKVVENMEDQVTLAAEHKEEILPKVDRHLQDGDEISLRSGKLKILHTPGHTAGSICILTDDGVLFSGDTIFADSIGRTDLPSGNFEQLKRSIGRLSIKKFTTVFPGHGPATTRDGIRDLLEQF